MRCPFCAEEIQKTAVLCRFCGATRNEDREEAAWRHPSQSTSAAADGPGFILRSSALLLLLGAAFELIPPTTPVPLFGAMRAGAPAVLYHLIFASTFFAVGVGLWRGTSWAYRATVIATALYSLDRLLFMLDSGARETMIDAGLGQNPMVKQAIGDMIDRNSMDAMFQLFAGVAMVGFWGLMLLVHRRRGELAK